MKKVLYLFVLFFLFPVVVFGKEYEVKELSMKIDIPDSYIVLTVDNYKGNPVLEELQITEEDIAQSFRSQNNYIEAYNIISGVEFLVYRTVSNGDFREYSSFRLKEYSNSYADSARKNGWPIANSYVKEINEIPFVVLEYEADGYSILDYVTLIDDKVYTFKFQLEGSSFTEENKAEFLEVLKTLSIDMNPIFKYTYLVDIGLFLITAGIIVLLKKRQKNMKNKCPYCKNEIDSETIFCTNCGNRVRQDN